MHLWGEIPHTPQRLRRASMAARTRPGCSAMAQAYQAVACVLVQAMRSSADMVLMMRSGSMSILAALSQP